MSWTNRVVWQEGMFLRTQHFQQQDRWTEQLVRTRAGVAADPWGLVDYALDRDLLGTGRFALASASGVFEDGTPFSLPGETDHPPPLELPEGAQCARLPCAADPSGGRGGGRRQRHRGPSGTTVQAADTHSASPRPADLHVGRLRMRYLLKIDERTGYLSIGLARVTQVIADRRIILTNGGCRHRWYAPPRHRWRD